MPPLLRRSSCVGIYLALVLAPLIVAVLADPFVEARSYQIELGVAGGFIAFALIAVEFALVARLRAASELFGTDALMMFHRRVGIAAIAFLGAHVLLLPGGGAEIRALLLGRAGPAARGGAIATVGVFLLVGLALTRRRLPLRYETWRWLHGLLAILAVAGMLHHALAIGGYSRSSWVAGLLWVYAGLFLLLLLHYRLLRPLLLLRRPWELIENRAEGGDTRTLVVRPVGHPGIAFSPGQFVWLHSGRSPLWAQDHPLSIASSAEPSAGGRVELSIKALGDWSRAQVPALRPGARLWLDGPYGAFTSDRAPGPGLVLIAGGIGITPMRSMLLTMRDRGDRRPVLLIHASRNAGRAVFGPQLAALAGQIELRVVPVYEEPAPDWRGERGWITSELLQRHLPAGFSSWQFFVCGPGPMMDAVEDSLAELGVASDRVHTERFDMV